MVNKYKVFLSGYAKFHFLVACLKRHKIAQFLNMEFVLLAFILEGLLRIFLSMEEILLQLRFAIQQVLIPPDANSHPISFYEFWPLYVFF